MARHKKVYRDGERETMKKQQRIRSAVYWSLAMFWIAAICFCGTFQHNDTMVGIGVIAIGIANTAYSIFAFCIRRLGWKTMTTYDSDEFYRERHLFTKEAKKEKEQIEVVFWIVDIVVVALAVFCFIGGIIKLV